MLCFLSSFGSCGILRSLTPLSYTSLSLSLSLSFPSSLFLGRLLPLPDRTLRLVVFSHLLHTIPSLLCCCCPPRRHTATADRFCLTFHLTFHFHFHFHLLDPTHTLRETPKTRQGESAQTAKQHYAGPASVGRLFSALIPTRLDCCTTTRAKRRFTETSAKIQEVLQQPPPLLLRSPLVVVVVVGCCLRCRLCLTALASAT